MFARLFALALLVLFGVLWVYGFDSFYEFAAGCYFVFGG